MKGIAGIIAVLMIFICFNTHAQNQYWSGGVEYQAYPTGHQPGIRAERGFAAHHAVDFRIGVNIITERDEGEQDLEEGNGFGFTAGYRYYLKPENNKWFGSFRTDLWFNEIDWIDLSPSATGTTKITVLQPTLVAGYVFEPAEGWRITPTLGGGIEFNIKEDGREVGEGPITLLGLNLEKRF